MTRALVTQLVDALENLCKVIIIDQKNKEQYHRATYAIEAAREYLATEPSVERAELIERLNECLSGPATLTPREATAIKDAVGLLEADADLMTKLARRTVERNMVIGMAVDGIDAQQAKSNDAEQTKAYGKACREQALEEAVLICESEYDNWDNERPLRICATAIRNLK